MANQTNLVHKIRHHNHRISLAVTSLCWPDIYYISPSFGGSLNTSNFNASIVAQDSTVRVFICCTVFINFKDTARIMWGNLWNNLKKNNEKVKKADIQHYFKLENLFGFTCHTNHNRLYLPCLSSASRK